MKENNVTALKQSAIFNSQEYQQQLKVLANEIIGKIRQADNEATVASSFENSLYYFIRTWFDKEVNFEKEKNLGNSVGHIFSNKRMDAVYNNLIIEYKHSSKLKNEKDIQSAKEQTIEYLQSHIDKNIEYDAIITDGINVIFITVNNKNIKINPITKLNANTLDRIIKSLVFFDKKKLTGENIANDFVLSSANEFSQLLSNSLFVSIKSDNIAEKTNMLYVEWQDLFHLSEADKGQNQDIDKRRKELSQIFNCEINNNDLEYKALFCLQTTYAIIIKLIAYKVLIQITDYENNIFDNFQTTASDDLRRYLQQLEDGLTFKNNGIRNLLEGDFFSWYCDENQWNNEICKNVKSIIETLISYEELKFSNSYSPQDLFKDLYLGIIPKSIRHSFGEYFTPAWLADCVVTRSLEFIDKKDWKGFDPTCGSGVFVIKMLENILKDYDVFQMSTIEKSDLLKNIVSRVKGLDLNPLSALTARINYFIAIFRLLDYNDTIEIPIYLGDAANLPQKTDIDGVECVKYTVPNQKKIIDIILPLSFVVGNDFSKIMFALQVLVKAEQPGDIYKLIMDKIPVNQQTKEIKNQIYLLAENLVFLHINKWDGIWVRIIYNFLSTVKLGKFDIIAGNPPWVKWEFLPQTYANKIKELCIDKHLFSGSVRTGGISLNICALIANTAALQWLSEDGVLAFLMPKTLMTQESYEGFRNFYLDNRKEKRLYLNAIDDWSKSGHPFVSVQEKFLTYFFKNKEVNYLEGVPVRNYIKTKKSNILEINEKKSYFDVSGFFQTANSIAKQLVTRKTGFSFIEKNFDFSLIIGDNFYKARSGAEFTPGELYFLEKNSISQKTGKYIFSNKSLKTAKHKIIPQSSLELETRYIYPLIKGPNINSFKCKINEDFAVFPYSWSEKRCLNFSELHSENETLAEYLLENKNLIQAQSKRSLELAIGSEFYSLSKIGEYTFVDCLVAFRDNTEMKACVITPVETPWGEKKMPVCAKHAPYISMTKTNRKITLNEAYYIAGILNTNIVKEYIAISNDSRSFSIDLKIKIPEYQKNDRIFKTISELSKEIHLGGQSGIENNHDSIEQIEELYLEICKLY